MIERGIMRKCSNPEIKCLTVLICFLCAVLVVSTIIAAAAHHKQQTVVHLVDQSVDGAVAILEGLDKVGVVEAQSKLNEAAELLREAEAAIRNYNK